jgi:hypothetical protein
MERTFMHAFHHPTRPVENIHLATSSVGFLLGVLGAGHRPEFDLLKQLQHLIDIRTGNAILRSFNSCCRT